MSADDGEDRALQEGAARTLPRMACALCRRRKMRCNRKVPCDTCVRLGFECVYQSAKAQSDLTFARPAPAGDGLQSVSIAGPYSTHRPVADTRPRMGLKKALHLPAPKSEWRPEQMTKETFTELEQTYFETIHKSFPILHQARYNMSLISEPRMRPPLYLRHIICALAALVSPKYDGIHESLYLECRRELDETELNDANLAANTISRPQTLILITVYEMFQMLFHRWWTTVARVVRVTQMMGLHSIDGRRRLRRSLPPAKDWVELEERRRTFWTAYCLDRYAAFAHGCPMIIDEKDIRTLLPVPEEAFEEGSEVKSLTLSQALQTKDMADLPPSIANIVLITELGQKLKVLQQDDFEVTGHNSPTDIWQKITWLDNTLHYAFSIPPHLAASGYTHTPILTFLHMCAPTSTIILHHAAEDQASSHGITPSSLLQSQALRLAAAEMVASTMRLAGQVDIRLLHPFTGACLYGAARVLMRALAVRTDPSQQQSLKVLLDAMGQLHAVNPTAGGYFKDLDSEFPGIREGVYQQFSPATTQRHSRSDTDSPTYQNPAEVQYGRDFLPMQQNGILAAADGYGNSMPPRRIYETS